MISSVNAEMVSYDNRGVLLIKDKNAFPGFRDNVFVMVHPTITYSLNDKVSFGVMPTFKYSLTSIVKNENWVQQNPYFIGLSVSLRRRF